MSPGQFRNRLLRNLAVRPRTGKLPHVFEVPERQASHLRELGPQVARQPVDDLAAPALLLLALEDLIADTPVEPDQLLVDGERGTRARRSDLALETLEQLGVTIRKGRSGKGLTADHCLHYRNVAGRSHRNSMMPASELEGTPTITHPADTSDTTPSMWDGNIAFARYDPRHHTDVAQLLFWSGRTHKLRVLRHGATPTGQPCPPAKGEVGRRIRESKTECLPNSIKGDITEGAIESIDLGPDLVSFLWKIDGPGVISTGGGWERFDSMTGRLSSSAPVTGEVLQVIHSGSVLCTLVAPIPRAVTNLQHRRTMLDRAAAGTKAQARKVAPTVTLRVGTSRETTYRAGAQSIIFRMKLIGLGHV